MNPPTDGAPPNGEGDGPELLPKGEAAGAIPEPKAEEPVLGADENGLGALDWNGVDPVFAVLPNGVEFVDPAEGANGDAGGAFDALGDPNEVIGLVDVAAFSSSGDTVLYFFASFANNSFSLPCWHIIHLEMGKRKKRQREMGVSQI